MRIKFLGLAVAAMATLGSVQAWGGDQEIAEQIIQRLKQNRQTGALRDFTLDMKVDKGVVLFRGKVNEDVQKDLVLRAADGIEGVVSVVDEVAVLQAAPVNSSAETFSLRDALETESSEMISGGASQISTSVADGAVVPTAGVELAAPVASKDQKIVSGVVSALGKAQKTGRLKGFGVDVKSSNGVVTMKGQASSESQRNQILRIAESIPGVNRVRNSISIPAAKAPLRDNMSPTLKPVSAPLPPRQIPAAPAVASNQVPVVAAPYRSQGMAPQVAPAAMNGAVMGAPVMGTPTMGTPMPMANYGVGSPIHESPNLPNYAWPGYSAYPNYAALTYPQQYSPSAWPYIGPFYPYPQVPLGWRSVALEWKDGWWSLDFTDKYR